MGATHYLISVDFWGLPGHGGGMWRHAGGTNAEKGCFATLPMEQVAGQERCAPQPMWQNARHSHFRPRAETLVMSVFRFCPRGETLSVFSPSVSPPRKQCFDAPKHSFEAAQKNVSKHCFDASKHCFDASKHCFDVSKHSFDARRRLL